MLGTPEGISVGENVGYADGVIEGLLVGSDRGTSVG